MVESQREINGRITKETRYGMVFRDDECRVRTENGRPLHNVQAHGAQFNPKNRPARTLSA